MSGAELIARERERQTKLWTAAHDDTHDRAQLTDAAMAYVYFGDAVQLKDAEGMPERKQVAEALWPFHDGYKPSDDVIRNYVKAGALIAAEIDRLQRLSVGRAAGAGGVGENATTKEATDNEPSSATLGTSVANTAGKPPVEGLPDAK